MRESKALPVGRLGVASLLLIVGIAAPATAGECKSGRYFVRGGVVDQKGRPQDGARVYILIDKITQKRFAREGVRARTTRTDATGRFGKEIVCGKEKRPDGSSRPSACASRPKYLTVAVDSFSHRIRLTTFKLSELKPVEQGGVCRLSVPAIRLSGGR